MSGNVAFCNKALALELIDGLIGAGLHARVFGGGAISINQYWEPVYGTPRVVHDIDIIVKKSEVRLALDVIREHGANIDVRSLLVNEGRRTSAAYKGGHVDMYSDPLHLSQTIEFANRLSLNRYTLTRADLLITKLQISRITFLDMQDIISLLAVTSFCTLDTNHFFNVDRVINLCNHSWNLHYACTLNLLTILDKIESVNVPDDIKQLVKDNIGKLLCAIDGTPKNLMWRLRRRIGRRIAWYAETDNDY